MTRGTVVASLATLGALAAASPATAGDIKVERVVPTCSGGEECRYFTEQPYDNHTFVGRPGEANMVTATRGPGETITFRDNGAPIADASNCQRITANEVRCTSRYPKIDAGDMNDTLIVVGNGPIAFGGPGNDTITGGDASDLFYGGPGNDTLRGGGSHDTLVDGDDGAADDRDVFDGGTGGAEVSYSSSTGIVNADLNDLGHTQGEVGEGDRFVGIDGVDGGTADDVLTATPAGSHLNGGDGDDALVGGDGDDQLFGGPGKNSVDAGGGRDSILQDGSDPTNGQSVECGDGPDVVDRPSRRDLVGADCETIEFDGTPLVRQRLPLRRLDATVGRVVEFECYLEGRPSAELRVARYWRRKGQPRAGTLIGRRALTRRACRGRANVPLRLSKRGRRLIRRFGLLPVEVRVNDPGNRARYVTEIRKPGA